MKDKFFERKQYVMKIQYDFKRIFNVNVSKFFNVIYGFDVVAFDEFLKVPVGVSTSDFIKEKYGKDAVKMIKAMF